MSRQRIILGALLVASAIGPIPFSAKAADPEKPKPLRVLMVASGPTREFQFLLDLLGRQVDKKQAELTVYLQPPLGQDKPRDGVQLRAPADRLLKQFPDKLGAKSDKAEDKLADLSNYDVIVAFDFDWSRVEAESLDLLHSWVEKSGGGLIVVAGPLHTLQLARPGANKDKLGPVLKLMPVALKDPRLDDTERNTDKPFRLTFPPVKGDFLFLKLDPDGKEPMSGWEEFFDVQKGDGPRRGFYSCFPVKSVKEEAVVVATFADPAMKLDKDHEVPFLVSRPTGKGRVVYLGGEVWRLRQHKEAFHERFWLGLTDYARGGTGEVKKEEKKEEKKEDKPEKP
jgi:hypothetical protein